MAPKLSKQGKEGLKDSYTRVDPQFRALEEENERLKRIVAKQALELEPQWRTNQKRAAKKTPIQPPGGPARRS